MSLRVTFELDDHDLRHFRLIMREARKTVARIPPEDIVAAAEELLVDDGWQAAAEPETVSVNGNGNGHHDAEDIGLTVELVVTSDRQHANGNGHHGLPSNGHGDNGHVLAPANGNGNGHHDAGPAEGQQSLFSWAEFLAEAPAKPNGRNGRPKTASASLFQWALDKEQEREKEPVGAGR